jgi:hypothetical protein
MRRRRWRRVGEIFRKRAISVKIVCLCKGGASRILAKKTLFMKKSVFVTVIFFVTLVILSVGCAPSKHSATTMESHQSVTDGQGDGTSFEKAIVVKAKSETEGVSAEYAWLKDHYPGYTRKGQGLSFDKGKSYDILRITTADGVEKAVYFDISGFFGK